MSARRQRRQIALPVLLAAALITVGGDAVMAEQVPLLPPAVAATGPLPFAYDSGCSGTAPAVSNPDFEQQVISLVNEQRRANGLPRSSS